MASMNHLNETTNGVGIRNYPEIDSIKRDAESLKNNARELALHAMKDGKEALCDASAKAKEQLEDAKVMAKEQLEVARERGEAELKRAEAFVRSNPRKSIAYAFAGGILASLLLLRK